MTRHDPEIEKLREEVNCAALLERLPPPWLLDRAESTKNSLKYRRGAGEVIIVNHEGRGWWDPGSRAKGDVFDLVQHFDPSLSFGQVRKILREFIGIGPSFPNARPIHEKRHSEIMPADRWKGRALLRPDSSAWLYLIERGLPETILKAAGAADVLRAGYYGSSWFAHHDEAGRVSHVEVRGPSFRSSLKGGTKVLFRLKGGAGALARFILAEAPIDALSLAAIEGMRADTLYAATGGGMGPATFLAIEHILAGMAGTANAIFYSAADANPAGDRYAATHEEIAAKAGIAFERLRPPIEEGDWNDILQQRAQQRNTP